MFLGSYHPQHPNEIISHIFPCKFYRILHCKRGYCLGSPRLPDRILNASLSHIGSHGFSNACIMAGIDSDPYLRKLNLNEIALSGLFPSSTRSTNSSDGGSLENIGPCKSLADRWLEEGNRFMIKTVKEECLTFEANGIYGVERAFTARLDYNQTISKDHLLQALALAVTPSKPFFGIYLPLEPPHLLPYGSHALQVSTNALAGLKDFSSSRTWMLRRVRLAAVYSAVELTSIGADYPRAKLSNQLHDLLNISEKAAASTSKTVEFGSYVYRSMRTITQNMVIF
ncbi:hypothetical protein BY996DRAFT_4577415 [Phakopsora pachyrhizi]|nr:hypothetical protein BY996DRAFT_4577415 [Phakopsora pachyrhizi]